MMTFVQFTAAEHPASHSPTGDDHIARIADAAYQVALQHGFTGSFVDMELAIWSAVRQELGSATVHSAEDASAEAWSLPAFKPRAIKG